MIQGTVRFDGTPVASLMVGGRSWTAIIDTGFNGDLELPESLRGPLQPTFIARIRSSLAAGQIVEEDNYRVSITFDGREVHAEATFTPGEEILLGTGLLQDYELHIDFPARCVALTRRE